MDSAKRVIDKFGSQSALARALGKRQSVVQHWVKKGTIPAKWHEDILRVASEMGLDAAIRFLPNHETRNKVTKTRQWPPVAKYFGNLIMGG
jgi:hypothetical protein